MYDSNITTKPKIYHINTIDDVVVYGRK